MSDVDVVDAEIVDEHENTPAREVAVRHQPTGILQPIASPEEVRGAMVAYQETVGAILDPSDWQSAGQGKSFVKKSGWRKIAKAFGLSVEIISSTVERDEDGSPARAAVVARAIAPNGQASDGDGYCDVAEERFSGPRGNKAKLENDLRATATTRAKNRAISDLVGMGEVSAEEMKPSASLQMVDAEADKVFRRQLGAVMGDTEGTQAKQAYTMFRDRHDGIPVAAAELLADIVVVLGDEGMPL